MKVILGIDPGAGGALCWLNVPDQSVTILDMPTFEITVGRSRKRQVDVTSLAQMLDLMGGDLAIIEKVGAMPKQGVTSSFNFGFAYGAVCTAVAAACVPSCYIAPALWKRHFKIPTGADKEHSRLLATQRLPRAAAHWSRKKDADRAEAALLALYGAETHVDLD